MRGQVVVTGVGLLSPLGQGLGEVSRSLLQGRCCRARAPAHPPGEARPAAVLPKMDYAPLLGRRGLKYHSEATLMLAQACLLALRQSGLAGDEVEPPLSLVVGSALGNHGRSTRYLRLISRDGPNAVQPMDGVDTAANSPVDFAAIRLPARGPVKMVSTGACSGLDAISEAARLAARAGAGPVVAAGFEKLYPEMVTAFARQGCLGPAGAPADRLGRPYDQASQGLVLGEGAAALVLESAASARKRGARVLGQVLGGAGRFSPAGESSHPERGLVGAIQDALAEAGCGQGEIGWVCGGAGGLPAQDRLELLALRRLYGGGGGGRARPAVSSLAGAWGHAFGAAGALSAAAALGCLEAGLIPASQGLVQPWPEAQGLDLVRGETRRQRVSQVLLVNRDVHGFCAALVLGRA